MTSVTGDAVLRSRGQEVRGQRSVSRGQYVTVSCLSVHSVAYNNIQKQKVAKNSFYVYTFPTSQIPFLGREVKNQKTKSHKNSGTKCAL